MALLEGLADRHRVLAFDRPGFGYSERPKHIVWTPEAQMELILRALRQLGVDRPVLYGHSWGACLVVTFALHHPDDIRGVVTASGYYYPNRRLDAAIGMVNVAPVIGPVMRNTISPVIGALAGNAAVGALFSPNPIPQSYAEFPASLALRPSQLRASAEDGTTLKEWAERTESALWRNPCTGGRCGGRQRQGGRPSWARDAPASRYSRLAIAHFAKHRSHGSPCPSRCHHRGDRDRVRIGRSAVALRDRNARAL